MLKLCAWVNQYVCRYCICVSTVRVSAGILQLYTININHILKQLPSISLPSLPSPCMCYHVFVCYFVCAIMSVCVLLYVRTGDHSASRQDQLDLPVGHYSEHGRVLQLDRQNKEKKGDRCYACFTSILFWSVLFSCFFIDFLFFCRVSFFLLCEVLSKLLLLSQLFNYFYILHIISLQTYNINTS